MRAFRFNLAISAALIAALALDSCGQERAEDDALSSALDLKISVKFLETPIATAMAYLQDQTGAPIVVDPSAEGAALTVNLNAVSVREGLAAMLPPADLDFTIRDGVIYVSTAERIQSLRAITRVYECKDLHAPVQDFNQRRMIQINYGDEATGVTFAADDSDLAEMLDPDMLREYVISRVDPDSWDHGVFSVNMLPGLMVVRHVPEVLDEIQVLIDGVRAAGARMIAVEIRVFSVARADLAAALGDDSRDARLLDAAGRVRLATTGHLLGRLALTGLNSQRVTGCTGSSQLELIDYDALIATSAVAYDPVVKQSLAGLSASVRPLIDAANEVIALDLDLELQSRAPSRGSRVATIASTIVTPGGGDAASSTSALLGAGGSIESQDLDSLQVATRLSIPLGKGQALIYSSAIAGDDALLVILVTPTK